MFRKYRSYSNHTTLLLRVRWKLLKTLLFLAYHWYFWSGNIIDVFSFSQYFCFFFRSENEQRETNKKREKYQFNWFYWFVACFMVGQVSNQIFDSATFAVSLRFFFYFHRLFSTNQIEFIISAFFEMCGGY